MVVFTEELMLSELFEWMSNILGISSETEGERKTNFTANGRKAIFQRNNYSTKRRLKMSELWSDSRYYLQYLYFCGSYLAFEQLSLVILDSF